MVRKMLQPAVRLEKVTKKIGRKTIISDLSLQINPGEVFGLLGPNGAGKTTTIRMMVGLISITAGDILINGWSISTNFCKAIAQVGAVIENPQFYPFLSGYHNLVHFANMYPMVPQSQIEKAIKMVKLETRIHDLLRTYSLGMRQRLGVAQALLHCPSILILDEPTNGLDPAGIRELRQYLRYLARQEGVTVIVSSHLLSEMELMCDRVAFIKEGKLLEVKPIGNLLSEEQWLVFQVDQPNQAAAIIVSVKPATRVQVVGEVIEVLADHETTAMLTAVLVKEGIKIYGIVPKARSLEDMFMEVTTE
jgi:ABC-2 type transport system ATP-binding protein